MYVVSLYIQIVCIYRNTEGILIPESDVEKSWSEDYASLVIDNDTLDDKFTVNANIDCLDKLSCKHPALGNLLLK